MLTWFFFQLREKNKNNKVHQNKLPVDTDGKDEKAKWIGRQKTGFKPLTLWMRVIRPIYSNDLALKCQ